MTAQEIFEEAITNQENALRRVFGEHTNVSRVCVGIGNAKEIPGIEYICPGHSEVWEGYKVERRRVDQLDNIYVSRIHS